MRIEVHKTCDINDWNIDVRKVATEIKQLLEPRYGNSAFWYGNVVRIDGNLKGFWKRAVTNVEIQIKVQDGQMFISAEGKCSFSEFVWAWFVFSWLWRIVIIWFVLNLIEYSLCRKLPEKYIEDALESMESKLKENPEKYKLVPQPDEQNPNINKENDIKK
ncbi:MAG: hypothetical protein PHV82_12470 [Victivallaceae bacterium]|nr:hypothetical protein [Victivallaceae bacterium]